MPSILDGERSVPLESHRVDRPGPRRDDRPRRRQGGRGQGCNSRPHAPPERGAGEVLPPFQVFELSAAAELLRIQEAAARIKEGQE